MCNDPYINHFTQPDSIIPQNQGIQAWDRYAYTNNNPLRYADPSGHGLCEFFQTLLGVSLSCTADGDNWIEGFDRIDNSNDIGLIVDPPVSDDGDVEGFDVVIEYEWGETYGPTLDYGEPETFDPVPEETLDDLVVTSDRNKSDLEFIKDLLKKYGLDPNDRPLREILHRLITRQRLEDDEIEVEVEELARQKKVREERKRQNHQDREDME